jgi:hypothetical protein
MRTITELDEELMNEHQHKLWLYFVEHDDWVGDSKEEIIGTFHADHEAVRIVHGEADIPHAFCISESGVLFWGFLYTANTSLKLKITARPLRNSRSFGCKRADSCESRSNRRYIFTQNVRLRGLAPLMPSPARRVQRRRT